MNPVRPYIPIIILFILAFYTATLVQHQQQRNRQPTLIDNTKIDAFAIDITAAHFDKSGNLHSQLASPKIVHIPLHDSAVLEKPHITIYRDHERPYHITAESGVSQHGSREFELRKNVFVKQQASEKNLGINLKTQALTVYPKKDYAETKLPVTIFNSRHKMSGVGMEAYLQEKRIKLLSKVKGTYDVGDYLS